MPGLEQETERQRGIELGTDPGRQFPSVHNSKGCHFHTTENIWCPWDYSRWWPRGEIGGERLWTDHGRELKERVDTTMQGVVAQREGPTQERASAAQGWGEYGSRMAAMMFSMPDLMSGQLESWGQSSGFSQAQLFNPVGFTPLILYSSRWLFTLADGRLWGINNQSKTGCQAPAPPHPRCL